MIFYTVSYNKREGVYQVIRNNGGKKSVFDSVKREFGASIICRNLNKAERDR